MHYHKLFATLALVFSTAATAEVHPTTLANHQIASERLALLIEESTRTKDGNLLENTEIQSLIHTLTNKEELLQSGDYNKDNLGQLVSMCNSTNMVIQKFLYAELLAETSQTIPPVDAVAKLVSTASNNMFRFGEYITPLYTFFLHCMAESVTPMNQFINSLGPGELTDIRRHGLTQAQRGIATIYLGALTAADEAMFPEEVSLPVATSLAEVSDRLVLVLPLSARSALRDQFIHAASAPSTPPEFQPLFREISASLSSESCTGACTVE